jgi:hypothetical protein
MDMILRVLVMKDVPCPGRTRENSQRMHVQVVHEWAQLFSCLAQRRARLDENCPLIAPLRALIHGYNEPTTTEDLWATGLDDEPAPLLKEPTPLPDEPTPLPDKPIPLIDEPTSLPESPARRAMPSLVRAGRWCCFLE